MWKWEFGSGKRECGMIVQMAESKERRAESREHGAEGIEERRRPQERIHNRWKDHLNP